MIDSRIIKILISILILTMVYGCYSPKREDLQSYRETVKWKFNWVATHIQFSSDKYFEIVKERGFTIPETSTQIEIYGTDTVMRIFADYRPVLERVDTIMNESVNDKYYEIHEIAKRMDSLPFVESKIMENFGEDGTTTTLNIFDKSKQRLYTISFYCLNKNEEIEKIIKLHEEMQKKLLAEGRVLLTPEAVKDLNEQFKRKK